MPASAVEKLEAKRAAALETYRETVFATAKGKNLPRGWDETLSLVGKSYDRFLADVSRVETRLKAMADRERAPAVRQDADAAYARYIETRDKADAEQREDDAACEARRKERLRPVRERHEEWDQLSRLAYELEREARRIIRETADPEHVRRTDDRIRQLRDQKQHLRGRLSGISTDTDVGKERSARWSAEIEAIDVEIRRLDSERYAV
ncbi:MAG: hypothetical protein IT428_00100 [Planctomycetaceae bacterium]|nr:hypothetical protein [Planctomycetaceae bacterium]